MYRRPDLPTGHGEVLTLPPYDQWRSLAEENARRLAEWDAVVGGVPVAELRREARAGEIAAAKAFSARIGVKVADPPLDPPLLAMSGHQPELYHTGIWVKAFLLQRFAEETGAAAIDLVVDSDSFDSVAVTAPCRQPEIGRCRQYLAVGEADTCFACSPVPSERDIRLFCESGTSMLATLPAPAILRHFREFCAALDTARPGAKDIAELLTFARRRYEAPAGTDYLELPVTTMAKTEPFLRFVAHVLFDAEAFRECYNGSLDAFRRSTGTRSPAQPFPDLEAADGRIEAPFWLVDAERRRQLWVRVDGGSVELLADDFSMSLPADIDAATAALRDSPQIIAPKAVTLTMFQRLFVADLFIHGVGGARYDAVTDEVIRRYFGIEPPRFTVASMTMYLPIGAHVITDEEVERAETRLKRLEHNPDEFLGDVDFESSAERDAAQRLADEKASLVAAIAKPDADKKTLGKRIREVNAQMAAIMEPLAQEMRHQVESLQAQRKASDIFTDRTYPYCYWSPLEIADKVR